MPIWIKTKYNIVRFSRLLIERLKRRREVSVVVRTTTTTTTTKVWTTQTILTIVSSSWTTVQWVNRRLRLTQAKKSHQRQVLNYRLAWHKHLSKRASRNRTQTVAFILIIFIFGGSNVILYLFIQAFKLKNPFLKIESICKQYKPIYQEFSEWHDINLDKIKGTHSPFQAYFSDE